MVDGLKMRLLDDLLCDNFGIFANMLTLRRSIEKSPFSIFHKNLIFCNLNEGTKVRCKSFEELRVRFSETLSLDTLAA